MSVLKFAFFDVDETLINLKSMFSFRDFYLLNKYGPRTGKIIIISEQERIKKMVDEGHERSLINKAFYQIFSGHKVSELQVGIKDWYKEVRNRPGFFIQPTLNELQSHQMNGVCPVFVSGSSQEILAPLAEELGVQYVLANKLEIVRDRYTGKIVPPQTIGIGKRDVILDFLKSEDSDPATCYGYGDHISDLPMLEYIGFPVVVAGDDSLTRIGKERGWHILCEASSTDS